MRLAVTKLLVVGAWGLLALPAQAQTTYTPLAGNAITGFTADVVANGSGPVASVTSASFDESTDGNYCAPAIGYISPTAGASTRGLPASGLLQNPTSTTPDLTFQLQSYSANNSLRIASTGTGSLTLATPQATQSVWVAAAVGNGDASGSNPVTMTVFFTDGTSQAFARDVNDWFGGTNFIVKNLSRVSRATNTFDLTLDEPRLYQFELALLPANYGKLVQRVQFAKTQPAGTPTPVILNVMAVTLAAVCSLPTAAVVAAPATVCPGQATVLTATLTGGGGSYTRQWQSSPDGITWTDIAGATGPTYTATPAATTLYRLRSVCSSTALSFSNVALVTVSVPTATLAYVGSPYCRTGSSPLPTATPAGGNFSAPAGLSINAVTGQLNLAASTPGTYTVTYSTAGPCAATATTSVTVVQSTAALAYSAGSYCRTGSSGAPTATPAGGTFSAPAGLVLNPATGAIDLAASMAGTYIITYTSGGPCVATATATVLIKSDALPVFPNVLTANGDGVNDVLRFLFLYPADLSGFRLQVFNRWGRRVYDGNNPTEGWNPVSNSGGTYYYVVDFTDCANHTQRTKAWVEVIK